jgi:cobalt-zinc-cadmium efflux system membrane fusion protein
MKQPILLISFLLTHFLISPAMAHEGHNKAFGSKTVSANNTQKTVVSPEGQKAIGLRTETVKVRPLMQTLRLTGQVTHADERLAELTALMPGLVKTLYVKEGDQVRKGQTVALLYSPEATKLLSDLLQQKAVIQREMRIQSKEKELAKVTLDREKSLYQEGISPKKDYLAAQNAYEVSGASTSAYQYQLSLLNSAAKSQLRVMGLSDATIQRALSSGTIPSTFAIVSPIDGVVTDHDVTLGETVNLNKKLFTIVNLKPIWIFLDIPQEQLSKIKMGQLVKMITASGETTGGIVSSVGKMVDPVKRTLPVRIESPNEDEILKPGLFVTADVTIGQSKKEGAVLPADAVVEENGQSVAFVKYDNYFQPVTLHLGQRSGDTIEVLDGLYEGDQVVVQGATQLRAQSLIASSNESEAKSSENPKASDFWTSDFWAPSGLLAGGILLGLLLGVMGTFFWLGKRRGN